MFWHPCVWGSVFWACVVGCVLGVCSGVFWDVFWDSTRVETQRSVREQRAGNGHARGEKHKLDKGGSCGSKVDHLGDRADGHPRQQRIGCLGALTQVFPPPPTTISGRFPARQRAQAPPPHSPFHLDAILGHFGAKVDQSGSFRLGALHPKPRGATRVSVARVHWHSHQRRKETLKRR